ncbi:substrate-binding domain-containing protein, partial [Escherichia coli]|uniref:substrate-binding domain-containing protein n=1 Tax=Escherichia coli TaxID=562 RepID=UPI00159B8AAF
TITADLGGERPAVVEIETGGTATAFADLATKSCDIGLASRRAAPGEAAMIARAGLGDLFSDASEHVLALDGIAVVVNRQNPSHHLSLSDLGRLYSGDQQAWSGDASALGQVV